MTLDKSKVNIIAITILDVMKEDEFGIPESFVYLPVNQMLGVHLDEFRAIIDVLIEAGLVKRIVGPRLAPGPRFAELKKSIAEARAR